MKTLITNLFLLITISFFTIAQAQQSNNYTVVVKPQSNFVMQETNYSAEIYLAKSIPAGTTLSTGAESEENETIESDGNKIQYSVPAQNVGMQMFSGTVVVLNSDNVEEKIPFEATYFVTKPKAAIMTKYLVKGIENPLEVSVAGVPVFLLTVECTNGTLSGSGGSYVVIPQNVGVCMITVKADINGEQQTIDSITYDVIEKK